MMENREKRERKYNLVIKGLKGKGTKNLVEGVHKFVEKFERGNEGGADYRRRRERCDNNTAE